MSAPRPVAGPRRHPRWFWFAVAAAALLLGGGVLIASLGYAATSGPEGVVRAYFAALARSDAPSALALGTVPDGPHTLLTSTVLREQQRLAPIRHVAIVATHRDGSSATVKVAYGLGFPGGEQPVTDSVPVHEAQGSWRLVRAAIPTQLEVVRAMERATIVGAGIPAGTVLIFPGAVPVRFDTAYLQVAAENDNVSFAALPTTQVMPEVSTAGKQAAIRAVSQALSACIDAGAKPDPRCPLPTSRSVPGSVRGAAVRAADLHLTVDVGDSAAGTLDIAGTAQVRGTYRRLTFQNRTVTGSGEFRLPVHATSYALDPLQITWQQ